MACSVGRANGSVVGEKQKSNSTNEAEVTAVTSRRGWLKRLCPLKNTFSVDASRSVRASVAAIIGDEFFAFVAAGTCDATLALISPCAGICCAHSQ